MLSLDGVEGFDWDIGNIHKINSKHGVTELEVEEIFFNALFLQPDLKHSLLEERVKAYGMTDNQRHLVVIFTIRHNKLRPISARNMNSKERGFYNAKIKEDSKI